MCSLTYLSHWPQECFLPLRGGRDTPSGNIAGAEKIGINQDAQLRTQWFDLHKVSERFLNRTRSGKMRADSRSSSRSPQKGWMPQAAPILPRSEPLSFSFTNLRNADLPKRFDEVRLFTVRSERPSKN
jgi:hypothetical protein